MHNNDIGTDSTWHIHIKKLIDIGYVTKDGNSQFQPTELGDTLVKAYTNIGLGELFNPKLHQSTVNASKSDLKPVASNFPTLGRQVNLKLNLNFRALLTSLILLPRLHAGATLD
ncbi:putative DNA topoisomerase [Helianthus anomalus]